MSKGTQIVDLSTQKVQRMMTHALAAILRIIHLIGEGRAGLTESH